MKSINSIVALLTAVAVCAPAQADDQVLYETGSASPKFQDGLSINSRDDWQMTGPAEAIAVSAAPPKNGGQGLAFDGGLLPLEPDEFIALTLNGLSAGQPSIRSEANILIRNDDREPVAALPPDFGLSASELALAVPNFVLLPDGKLLVAVNLHDSDFHYHEKCRILRLGSDGSIDSSYPIPVITPPDGKGVAFFEHAVLPDGGILVWSTERTLTNKQLGRRVNVRLRPDGSIDDTFPDISTDPNSIAGLFFIPQPDGKLLVFSEEAFLDGRRMPKFFRLNADNSVDAGFDPTLDLINGLNFPFNIRLLPDGKLLVGAHGSSLNPGSPFQLRRLHADGSLDTAFRAPANYFPLDAAPGIYPLRDGQIFVRSRTKLNRLRPDGSIDPDFATGEIGFVTGARNPSMTIQPLDGGHLLLQGEIKSYNGATANGIVRVQPNGALDPNFRSGLGFLQADGSAAFISASWPLPGGRFLVDGGFGRYDGQAVTSPIVLNADGTRDPSFVPSLGSSALGVREGHAILWTPKGLDRIKLSATGTPTSTPPRVVSVIRDAANLTRLIVEAQPGQRCALQASENLSSWIDLKTETAATTRLEFTDDANAAHRFYRIQLLP